MATKANAVAIVYGVTDLTAPHALLRMTSAFLCDSVVDRGTDLLDPHSREGRGDVEGGVYVVLELSKGIGSSETGQATIKSLLLHLK